MSTYSIGSDSPRWWWPSAAAGVVGAAAVSAILVIPTTDAARPATTSPDAPPALTSDPWVTAVDPSVGGQCFARPPRWTAALDAPTCGRGPVVEPWSGTVGTRPGLDARP